MLIRKEFKTEYKSWRDMRSRCNCITNADYPNYGGRGIKISKEWDSFENFLADMGKKPSTIHSIDRIDVNGGYCKENCRWATPSEQSNNRRSNVLLTFRGKTMNIAQWTLTSDLTRKTIEKRIKRGWTPEQVLTIPNLGVHKGEKRVTIRGIKNGEKP